MKGILYGLVLLFSISSFAPTPPVDDHIVKKFTQNFPYAVNPKWYEYENSYEVLFEDNKVMCRVVYDLTGKLISVRRDYYEKDLSLFITAKVKEKYPGKKIFGITEVTSSDGITYTIVLEDEKNWVTITSNESGNISLVQKLKKA
jgi:hypothetical protein